MKIYTCTCEENFNTSPSALAAYHKSVQFIWKIVTQSTTEVNLTFINICHEYHRLMRYRIVTGSSTATCMYQLPYYIMNR